MLSFTVILMTAGSSDNLLARLLKQGADCLSCKTVHWFRRKLVWGEADWPSSRMEACLAFKVETAPQRAKLLEDLGGCILCTLWAHSRTRCNLREPRNPGPDARTIKCQEKIGEGVCGREHLGLLHGSEASHALVSAATLQPRLAGAQDQTYFEDSQGAS